MLKSGLPTKAHELKITKKTPKQKREAVTSLNSGSDEYVIARLPHLRGFVS
jgi:hypothetical protein